MEEEEEYEITWVANDLDFCHQRKVLKKRESTLKMLPSWDISRGRKRDGVGTNAKP